MSKPPLDLAELERFLEAFDTSNRLQHTSRWSKHDSEEMDRVRFIAPGAAPYFLVHGREIIDRLKLLAKETVRANEAEKELRDGFSLASVHSCHANCQRPGCVLRRENEQLRAEVQGLKDYNRDTTAQMLRNDQGARGEIRRLRTALEEIAQQETTSEVMAKGEEILPDNFDEAYDIAIKTARDAIAQQPGAQTDGEAPKA